MVYFLKQRATQLQELADAPDCDPVILHNTYTQFKTLNLLASRWRNVYEVYIKPILAKANRTLTLLDIGCGGGDIALSIAEWASRDNFSLKITAIDMDIRAINFASKLDNPHDVQFCNISTQELIAQNSSFDFIISNHFIHHTNKNELKEILAEVERMVTEMVIFNDIERSDILYYYYAAIGFILKPFFSKSFIWVDGLRSIMRGYTRSELMAIAQGKWQVKRLFFSRLLLIYSR